MVLFYSKFKNRCVLKNIKVRDKTLALAHRHCATMWPLTRWKCWGTKASQWEGGRKTKASPKVAKWQDKKGQFDLQDLGCGGIARSKSEPQFKRLSACFPLFCSPCKQALNKCQFDKRQTLKCVCGLKRYLEIAENQPHLHRALAFLSLGSFQREQREEFRVFIVWKANTLATEKLSS